ncbi:uncharacterized protein LOC122252139 [Penaeus japonicus]|uniref:uncharacterized protein LOC122252139 n=1 Tax=Penaeus japonicus TaxID=27405 RepID=UPI001C70B716|nr:uncharacterized protein LOC122252139 [Penaeus japonicus]
MLTDGDLAATARDGYDAFDCSRAVALIGFLGLLSNFQDIIDDIVNNGRRKRRHIESAPPHEIRLWDALQDVLSALTSTPGTLNSTQSEDDFDNNEQQSHLGEQEQDILQEKNPHSGLLSDLAEVGPQLALWIVDVADGRLPGDRGHLNACEVSRILSRGHGWPGSFAAHLLTSTMAGALSSHTSSRKLLKESGLLDGTSSCTY